MTTKVTSIWNSQLIEASSLNIVAGVETPLISSAQISNESGTIYNSIKVNMVYEDLLPANVLGSFYIGARLEYKDANGIWQLTPCYQFSALRRSTQPLQRVLIMQPNIDTFNLGTDDSIFPNDREIARISRAQGTLPEAFFRVCVTIVDNDPGGPSGFQSVKLSCEVEQYNV